jgi:hypothetical protein
MTTADGAMNNYRNTKTTGAQKFPVSATLTSTRLANEGSTYVPNVQPAAASYSKTAQ